MYIGKEITRLVSFTEVKGEYYIHLEFIGTFKIGKAIKKMIGGKERIIVIIDELITRLPELSEDPLIIDTTIDPLLEEKRLRQIEKGKWREAGWIQGTAELRSPCRIKKTFIKYKWMKENGFIGPDDKIILENKYQYGMYKSIDKFIEYNQEYIRAIKDTNRTTTYKFSKYGVEGEIAKKRDGTGTITLFSPKDEEVVIEYLVKEDFGKIYNITVNKKRKKYYEDIEENDIERIICEINHMIESMGGNKFIK